MLENTVTIVLSHANNEWRKHLLKECLLSLKGEVILSTNHPVDIETQNLCDWVVYNRKNEILKKEDYPKYNVFFEYWYYDLDNVYHEFQLEFDHGYAAYSLIKNGVNFAKTLNKEKIHIINYDYKISPEVFEQHNNELELYDFVCYRYRETSYHENSYCTGVFSARIEPLLVFSNHYTSISDYYSKVDSDNIVLEVKFDRILNSKGFKILEKKYEELEGITDGENVFSTIGDTNRFKEIGIKYECDKVIRHSYHEVYPKIFEKYLGKQINLFEIGIDEGKSLKLWKDYCPSCSIFGMDDNLEMFTQEFSIAKGNQTNIDDLKNIVNIFPKCEIIVDDGSHIAEHQLKSFEYFFENLLSDGGTYVIEDIECSYWAPDMEIYGCPTGRLNIIDYFTNYNHQLNEKYSLKNNNLKIKQITFFLNCIIIEKL